MNQSVRKAILMISCVLLQACASQPGIRPPGEMVKAGNVPPPNPALDHYIAWVPLERAQTATVAEAMAHVSLRNAREQTSHDLCNGEPVTSGIAIEKFGPVTALTPESMGGRPAWYYRISLQPGLNGCRNEQSANLYQALRARLPSWINLSQAGSVPDERQTTTVMQTRPR